MYDNNDIGLQAKGTMIMTVGDVDCNRLSWEDREKIGYEMARCWNTDKPEEAVEVDVDIVLDQIDNDVNVRDFTSIEEMLKKIVKAYPGSGKFMNGYLKEVNMSEFLEKVVKTREYLNYVEEHYKNVQDAWGVIKGACKDMNIVYDDFVYGAINEFIIQHDMSKLSAEEFIQYRENFRPISDEEKCEGFDAAWENHKKCNPHHWQNWVEIDDENPYTQLVHCVCMVADWIAMGMKFGDTARDYYEKNKGEIKIPDWSVKLINEIFDRVYSKKAKMFEVEFVDGRIGLINLDDKNNAVREATLFFKGLGLTALDSENALYSKCISGSVEIAGELYVECDFIMGPSLDWYIAVRYDDSIVESRMYESV